MTPFCAAMCPVCEGAGFVKAAPLSGINRGFGGVAQVGRNHRRVALWARAVTVPCWACGGGAA